MEESVKKYIDEQITLDMQTGISNVINGKTTEWRSNYLSMRDVRDYLESKGARNNNDFDSNVWKWDAWISFTIDCKKYVVQGCGFSGGVSFYRSDDDELDDEPIEENIEDIKDWM